MRQTILRLALLLACLGNALAAAGCGSNGASTAISYNETTQDRRLHRPSGAPYSLRTNDQLRVQVYNEPTITGDYVIDSSGYLSIPVAGRVRAAGVTAEQLERRITAQLNNGILKDARVNVQVMAYAPFYIHGEVKKAGEFLYKPGMTVADAVALAGGFTYRADESRAYVRPTGSVGEIVRPLDTNPSVSPGDNIRIPERFL